MKDLVLIGGGHAHVEVIKRLSKLSPRMNSMILISDHRYTPYSGMLPGLIAGHYSFEECHIDLLELCKKHRFEFIEDKVIGVNHDNNTLETHNSSKHRYDIASIDTGSTPSLHSTKGASTWVLPIKPVPEFLDGIKVFFEKTKLRLAGEQSELLVVGGGAASVEVALSLNQRIRQMKLNNIRVTLATENQDLLTNHALAVRRQLKRKLHDCGIRVLYGSRIKTVDNQGVITDEDDRIDADLTIWCTGASAPPWPSCSNLPTTPDGFIRTDQTLRVLGTENLFAAGDISSIDNQTYPKSGVYAVKQGPVLATNIENQINEVDLIPYRPQKHSLAILSTGGKHAVASRSLFCASGRWVWHLKDYIDRRFMRQYQSHS